MVYHHLDQHKEFILLEVFKNCVPDCVVVYKFEQKVASLSEAATLADKYMLTHKTVFTQTPFVDIDLADTFISDSPSDTPVARPIVDSPEVYSTREALVNAQGADPSLESCCATAIKKFDLKNHPNAYFFHDHVLMCKWTPPDSPFN